MRPVYISGSSDYIDKKQTDWHINEIGQDGMVIKLNFESPVYIARDERSDFLKVSFYNTGLFLVPVDENKQAVPNGYT